MTFDDWARSRLDGLLAFAIVLCCDRGIAEDTVQDVLIKILRRWDRISRVESPDAYARRMIVNQYLSWRRKWARYVPVGDVRVQESRPDHADMYAERAALIGRLAALPPKQRAVIVLRYYADFSDEQIAQVLSCRPVTVRTQASRALKALRVQLSTSPQPSTQPGVDHAR
jgi:RNA polymerase sigma-70 factor (sigma-E family)